MKTIENMTAHEIDANRTRYLPEKGLPAFPQQLHYSSSLKKAHIILRGLGLGIVRSGTDCHYERARLLHRYLNPLLCIPTFLL